MTNKLKIATGVIFGFAAGLIVTTFVQKDLTDAKKLS